VPRVTTRVTDSGGHAATAVVDYTVSNPTADLVAVAVFPTYTAKTYGNHAAVLGKLQALGVRNMRHLLLPTMSTAVRKFTTDANALGIKSWCTIGNPRAPFTDAEWTQVETLLKGALRGCVTRVFSWNEANNRRSTNDPPLTNWDLLQVTECQKLWAMVQRVNADYGTDGTPRILVGTPGLWSGNIAQQYDDLNKIAAGIAGTFDFIGWHLYMRPVNGTFDASLIVDQETHFRAALGNALIVCTESGYFTAPNYTGGSNPVTEAQQAALYPQLLDWYTSRGYGVCGFELLDDPDPTGANRESWFGLVRCPAISPSTWTDKPAFATVKAALA